MQLDSRWKSDFHHLNCVTVEDSRGNEVATTLSSFLIKLQTKAWLPGKIGQQHLHLFRPIDLYLETTAVYSVLDVFGHYSIPNLEDETFIDAIKLKTSISMETVFERLNEWSRDDTFCTSMNHMINVYRFIRERMNEVDPAELNIPLVFVPSEEGISTGKTDGKFYQREEVCLYDHTGLVLIHISCLRNKKALLDKFYPKDILNFFEKDLNIDATPTIHDYMGIACALADNTRLPDADACLDLMEVFSVIGRKCVPIQNGELFTELVQYCDNFWSGYQQVAGYLDFNSANFVFENLKEEKIFPTSQDKFVSIKEKPLLPDSPYYQRIFEKEDKIHFIVIPEMRESLDDEPMRVDQKEDIGTCAKRRLKQYGILAFFAVCRIDVISSVVCDPRVLPENSVEGCETWHRNFSALLPYVQRYIHAKLIGTYDVRVEESLPKKLRNLTFFTASSIDTIHELKDMDIHVTIKETCFVEYTEDNIYFYLLHQSIDDAEDILAKFVEIFDIKNKKLAEELCDLLTRILHYLGDVSKVEKILEKKRIPTLPESEDIWKLKDISKKGPLVQIAQRQVPEQFLPPTSRNMKCWPPKMQVSLGVFPPHSHVIEENTLPFDCIEPARQELSSCVALDSSSTATSQVQTLSITNKPENSAHTSTELSRKEANNATANTPKFGTTAVNEQPDKMQSDVMEEQPKCLKNKTATQGRVDAYSVAAVEAFGNSHIQDQRFPTFRLISPQKSGLLNVPPRTTRKFDVTAESTLEPVVMETQKIPYELEKYPDDLMPDGVSILFYQKCRGRLKLFLFD